MPLEFEIGILEQYTLIADGSTPAQFRNLSNYDYYHFESLEVGLHRMSERGWQLRCPANAAYTAFYMQRIITSSIEHQKEEIPQHSQSLSNWEFSVMDNALRRSSSCFYALQELATHLEKRGYVTLYCGRGERWGTYQLTGIGYAALVAERARRLNAPKTQNSGIEFSPQSVLRT